MISPRTIPGAVEGDGQRLDPRVSLLALLAGIGAILAFSDWPTLGLIAVVLLAFTIRARMLQAWLRTLRGVWLLAAIIFAVDELSYGAMQGALAAAKLLLLVATFACFFLSTNPDDLALALISLKVPFTFAFILAATANYVPVVSQEAHDISDAFRARGLSPGRWPWGAIRFYAAMLAPLVIATIRRSLRLSEALEARAFGASRKRTSLRVLHPGIGDGLIALAICASITLLALAHAVR